jgi:hypothetical protein
MRLSTSVVLLVVFAELHLCHRIDIVNVQKIEFNRQKVEHLKMGFFLIHASYHTLSREVRHKIQKLTDHRKSKTVKMSPTPFFQMKIY